MCDYHSGEYRCKRPAFPGHEECVFHVGWRTLADVAPPPFQSEFNKLADNGDGNWKGFVFPKGTKFPDSIPFKVYAQESRFEALDLEKTKFTDEVDFSGSFFHTSCRLKSVEFHGSTKFDRCRFLGPSDWHNVQFHENASFGEAEFVGRAVLRVFFSKHAILDQVVFRDSVTIIGWRRVPISIQGVATAQSVASSDIGLLSGPPPGLGKRTKALLRVIHKRALAIWTDLKKRLSRTINNVREHFVNLRRKHAWVDPRTTHFRVFGGEGRMEGVEFMKPEQTRLSEVDLSRVTLRGTNFRGVQFLGVSWWQPALRRNGLYDEVLLSQSTDGPSRYSSLPAVEEACRNLRAALEQNKNYNVGSDFYIAEMEAARLRLPFFRRSLFSIYALYRAASRYGTSVGAALWFLLLLIMLYTTATTAITLGPEETFTGTLFFDSLDRSIRMLIFQFAEPSSATTPDGQRWLDALFRPAGLTQIALVALALRSRIKRH